MKCIRRATRADAPEIYSLRLSEYIRAEEFRLAEPMILLWNERDDAVLGSPGEDVAILMNQST
jgi:hypothetical protein